MAILVSALKFRIAMGLVILAMALLAFLPFRYKGESLSCKNCNVILFSIDQLRSDHMGIYGYHRETTPAIDRFFKNGFKFENVISQSMTTLPSVASLFTGVYPSRHGLNQYDDPPINARWKTLAEIVKLYGYRTYVGSDGGGFPVGPQYGTDRGFDEHKTYNRFALPTSGDGMLDFLVPDARKEKFFLYIFTNMLHDPYLPPPPFNTLFDTAYSGGIISDQEEFNRLVKESGPSLGLWPQDEIKRRMLWWSRVATSSPRDVEHLKALYDGNVRGIDTFFADFIKRIRAYGLLQNTIVILTAPHGEEFDEHGGFARGQVYDETIRVPLLVYVPKTRGRMIGQQVGAIDIMPTILDLIGAEIPQDIDGGSVKSIMRDPMAPELRPVIFSEFPGSEVARTLNWKLVKKTSAVGNISYELYNIALDPAERTNLIGKGLEEENKLKLDLTRWEEAVGVRREVDARYLNVPFIGYPP